MRLSEVVIQNFCSCEAVTVPLSDFNPIVGYNNSGKSNILRAINWLLKKSVLPSHMFNKADEAVIVEGVIENVDLTLLPGNQSEAVAPYVHEGALKVRRRQDSVVSTAAQIKLDVYDYATATWKGNPAGLDNALSVLFPEPLYIEAMEDAGEDIAKFGAKNTIGLLLKRVLERIHANNQQAVAAMQAALAQVSGHLNGAARMTELNQFETEATAAIASFFPGLSFHVNFATPAIDELFKSSTINLSEAVGSSRPFASFGHGAQRSAHMALIKLLADVNAAGGANPVGTTVLLIDEPELYLHPQAIELLRASLLRLSTQNFQVVFSTHSPLLVGAEHALQTLMIYKDAQHRTIAREKLQSAAAAFHANPHHTEVIFSLQSAAHLLFSNKVLLVEGKTETLLVPQIYQTSHGRSYAHDKGCLVSGASSSALLPMMQVLRAVGFSPKAVADLDFAFKVARPMSLTQLTRQSCPAKPGSRLMPQPLGCFSTRVACHQSARTRVVGSPPSRRPKLSNTWLPRAKTKWRKLFGCSTATISGSGHVAPSRRTWASKRRPRHRCSSSIRRAKLERWTMRAELRTYIGLRSGCE